MSVFYNRQRLINIGAPVGGEDAARLLDIQNRGINDGGTSGGTANAQTITTSPAITTLLAQTILKFKADNTNTGAMTLSVNGTSYSLKKIDFGTKKDVFPGDIKKNGEYLVLYDGTDLVLLSPQYIRPYTIHRDSTTRLVENTTAETSITSLALPANVLGLNTGISFWLAGHIGNNAGISRTFQLRIKLGATTIYTHTTSSITSSATLRPTEIYGRIVGRNSATAQISDCHWLYGTTTLGVGGTAALINVDAAHAFGSHTTIAEDATTALTLDFTIQMSGANSSTEIQIQHFEVRAI